MASYGRKFGDSNGPSTSSSKQLVDSFSGVGRQFKVKFVGCDNVSRKRGDAEAAKYAIMSLKNAVKQMKTHKPRAVLGLTLKGMSIFDEQTKNTTRVPLQKVIYVAHDCEEICFFGIIVGSKESHTGFKLYCFKAEQKIAISFVRSSQELFSLMYKLKKAKQQIKEQREGTSGTEGADNKDKDASDPSPENVDHSPTDNAPPPPSYGSVTDQPWPSDIPKAPEVNQDRRQKAIDEWNRLENELTDIAKELNLGDEQNNRPEVKEGEAEHTYAQVKKKAPQESPPTVASETSELEAIFGGELLQSSPTPNQPSTEDQIQFSLNPFQGGNLFPAQSTAPLDFNFSSPASTTTTSAPGAQVEPSIAFDLSELFQAPVGGYQPTVPMDAGNPFAQPAPLGGPPNTLMGGPMGGPVGGPMGGPLGGPVGGPMGGPLGGPVGGRPLGGPAAAPMGTVFGAQPQIQATGNPFTAFQSTGAGGVPPQQSGDLFSSVGDTFMQSAFAQPLLPEPTLQPAGVRKPGAGPPPKPEPRDAFADLVSIAKSKPAEKNVPPVEKNVSLPPPARETVPKLSMMDMMRQKKEASENKINQDMLFAFGEATDSGSHQQQQSLPAPLQQVPAPASVSATAPLPPQAPPATTSSTQPNWVGFDNVFGDPVTTPSQPSTSSQPATSSQQNWTGFDEGFGSQFSIPLQPQPSATVPQPAAATTSPSWVSF